MVAEFLMIVVGGLKFGAIYALAALGIVVIHKATRTVNFAHGAFVLAGAYATYGIVEGLKLGYWPAYLLVPIAAGRARRDDRACRFCGRSARPTCSP